MDGYFAQQNEEEATGEGVQPRPPPGINLTALQQALPIYYPQFQPQYQQYQPQYVQQGYPTGYYQAPPGMYMQPYYQQQSQPSQQPKSLFEQTAMKCHELVALMRNSLKVHRTRDAWRLYKEIEKTILQNSNVEHHKKIMETELLPINAPMPPSAQPKLKLSLDPNIEKEAVLNSAEPITEPEEVCIVAFLQACAFKSLANNSVTGFGGRVFSYRDLSQVMHLLRDEKVVRAPGNAAEMERILNRMLHLNLLPGTGDYTSLIATQGRLHNLPRALHHYRALLALLQRGGAKPKGRGKDVTPMQPDIITLNTMIDVLGRNGDLPGSLRMAAEIDSRGLAKTRSTYNVLIAVCGMNGDLWGAWRWFEEMVKLSGCLLPTSTDASLEPNDITFSNLLDPLSRHSPTTFPLFLLIWTLMTTHPKFSGRGQVVPNAGHWNSALRALCRAGEWEIAWRVYAAMCAQAGTGTGVNQSLASGGLSRGGPRTPRVAMQAKEMASSAVAFQMAICPPELVKAARQPNLSVMPEPELVVKKGKKPDFKLGLDLELPAKSSAHLPASLVDPITYSRSVNGNLIPPPTSTTHTLFATHLSSLLGLHDLALRVLEAYGSSSGGPLPTASLAFPTGQFTPQAKTPGGSYQFPQHTLHPNQQIIWGRDLYHARLGVLVRKQDWESVMATWKIMCFGDNVKNQNQIVGISHTTWRALLTALPPAEEDTDRSRTTSGSSGQESFKHSVQILPSQIPTTLLRDLVTMAEESHGASPSMIVLQTLGIPVDPFTRGRNKSGQVSGGSIHSSGSTKKVSKMGFQPPPNVPGPRALSPPPGKGFGQSSNISAVQLASFVGGVTSQLGSGSILDAAMMPEDNGQMLPPMAPDEWDDTLDIPMLSHRNEAKKSLLGPPTLMPQALLDYQSNIGTLTKNLSEAGPETLSRAFSWTAHSQGTPDGTDHVSNFMGSLLSEL
jgi:pentatricopeptide repeat protein